MKGSPNFSFAFLTQEPSSKSGKSSSKKAFCEKIDTTLKQCISNMCTDIYSALTQPALNQYLKDIEKDIPAGHYSYVHDQIFELFNFWQTVMESKLKYARDFNLCERLFTPKKNMLATFSLRRLADLMLRYDRNDLDELYVMTVTRAFEKNILYILAESDRLSRTVGYKESRLVYQYSVDKLASYIDQFGLDEDNMISDADYNPSNSSEVMNDVEELTRQLQNYRNDPAG